jgi:hypothetical protein
VVPTGNRRDLEREPYQDASMAAFTIVGLDDRLTTAVRQTRRSPEYGHPAVQEIASGTGPCRACLRPFTPGAEERILFTYRPAGGTGTVSAPGPVFIHAAQCQQYRGSTLPEALRSFPLLIEAWAAGNVVPAARHTTGAGADRVIAELLDDPLVDYLHVRHAEAGCHIARVDREASGAPGPGQ